MTKTCRYAVLFAFLLCLAHGAAMAAGTVDLDDGPLASEYYGGDVFYSSGGKPHNSGGIKLSGTNDFGGTGEGFTARIEQIDINALDSTITLNSAGGAAVNLKVGNLNAQNGNVDVILNSGTRMDIDALQTGAGIDFKVNTGGTLAINTNAIPNTGPVKIDMIGGRVQLQSGTTLAHGSIGGSGELAVGSGLTVAGDNMGDVAFNVNGTLNVVTALGSGTLGKLTLGRTGKFADFNVDGILNVGALIINEGVDMSGSTGGEINATTLTVKGDFTDVASVDTIVRGLTTVDKGVTYTVTGTGNEYRGGMELLGTLTNDGLTTITFGDGANLARLNVKGGAIVAANDTFTIDNADIWITEVDTVGAPVTLDASTGRLNLSTSDVTVALRKGSATTFDATSGIDINNYAQIKGDVHLTGVKMSVEGTARIGNAASTKHITLHIDDGAEAHFKQGLTLDRYGALASEGGGISTVMLGDSTSENLLLSGNNALLGIDGTLRLSTTNGGTLGVAGHDNIAHGKINAQGFDLNVAAGGILNVASNVGAAPGDGLSVDSATIHGRLDLGTNAYGGTSGAPAPGILDIVTGSDFRIADGGMVFINHGDALVTGQGDDFLVNQGGKLTAETADITANGFGHIRIDGAFTAGWDGGDSTKLIADTDVTISSTGSVSATKDLVKNAVGGEVLIDTTSGTGVVTNNGNWSYKSMYGTLEYGLRNNDQELYIVDIKNRLNGTDEEKRQQALNNLRGMWCPGLIRDDFGNIVYDVMEGIAKATPPDSESGLKNMGLFEAVGNPDALNVSSNTIEYMNGGYLYGITDVAMETSRTFVSDITNRTKVVRCQFVAAADVWSTDALATTAMNSNYRNRLWVDGHGYWQTGDARECFSGYSYDASGFTVGYDRALLKNVAFGFAGAYNDGTYEDKGALASDSKIESFSAGAYATYSDQGGAYATLYAGYTYSDNTIRDYRNDPTTIDGSSSWAESHFRTATYNVGLNLGYDLRCGSHLVVTPSVGINYIQSQHSDHTAFLGEVATQKLQNARNRGLYVPLELTAQYDTCLSNGGKLRLEVNGSYAYNLRKKGMQGEVHYIDIGPANVASIAGPDNQRYAYRLGGGVRYAYNNYDIGARYDYVGKEGYNAHRLTATLGMSF